MDHWWITGLQQDIALCLGEISLIGEVKNRVSKSNTEAEFRELSSGVDEILWIRGVLKDLQIPYEEPIRMFCDNKSATYIAQDPVNHNRTKHIEIDRFYIKEKIEEKILCIDHIPTTE